MSWCIKGRASPRLPSRGLQFAEGFKWRPVTRLLGLGHIAGGACIGEPMPPFPARKNAWGIYDVFEAADRKQVFIGITSDTQWTRFCQAFSLASLAEDRRLSTNAKRSAEREWLVPRLEAELISLSSTQITAACETAAVPYACVGQPEDLINDPQLMAHGGLIATALGALGAGPMGTLPGLPLYRQPPKIGEHGEEILKHAGFRDFEIAKLVSGGVLVTPRRGSTAVD